jgi:hypothetical protein
MLEDRTEEYSPGPYRRMTPAGIPGVLAVLLVVFGSVGLLGLPGFVGLSVMAVVSLGLAVAIQKWHGDHPTDSKVLHLTPRSGDSDRKA